MDETEIAAADGAVRRGASGVVMRVVPEDRVTVGFGPGFQKWGEADAVDEGLERLHAGHLEEGGVEVDRDGRGGFDQTGLGHARPEDDERDADAAFVGGALAGPERRVVGRRQKAAVVGREDDDRIVVELQALQRGADRAKRIVDARDKRGVGRVLLLKVGSLFGLVLELRDHVGLAGDRLVDCVVRQVDEEGFVFVYVDELHRLVGLAVGEELAGRTIDERGNLVG